MYFKTKFCLLLNQIVIQNYHVRALGSSSCVINNAFPLFLLSPSLSSIMKAPPESEISMVKIAALRARKCDPETDRAYTHARLVNTKMSF